MLSRPPREPRVDEVDLGLVNAADHRDSRQRSSDIGDGSRPVVLQVGPSPGTPGGMASVLQELLQTDFPGYRLVVAATYGRRTGIASLTTAVGTAFRIVRICRHWDIAHVHMSQYGSFIREGLIVIVARFLAKPVVITLHGPNFDHHISLYPRLTRAVLNRADHIFCLGRRQQELVHKVVPDIQTSLVMNPISVASRHFESDLSPQVRGHPTFVFVGEVGHRKGVDRLFAAWPSIRSTLTNASLMLVGPLTDGVQVPDLPGLTYMGVLNREDLQKIMRRATMCVLPSRAEALPMAVLESLAVGTPALVTTVGEWENFVDCPAVTLLDTRTASESEIVESLAHHLVCAVPADRTTAIEWARDHAGPDVVARQLASVYDTLRKPGRHPFATRRHVNLDRHRRYPRTN